MSIIMVLIVQLMVAVMVERDFSVVALLIVTAAHSQKIMPAMEVHSISMAIIIITTMMGTVM